MDMSVKDLKVQLGFARDEDRVFIECYNDQGDSYVTDDVTVDIKEGSLTVVADLPRGLLYREGGQI